MSISYEEALGLKPQKPKMQQNATLTPKQLSIQERRQRLIEGIFNGKEIQILTEELNCDRTTLYRDFEEWAKTDQAQHLLIEWHQQYEKMKGEDRAEAFRGLTRLVMKVLEKQAKVEVNVTNQTAIFRVEIIDNSQHPISDASKAT